MQRLRFLPAILAVFLLAGCGSKPYDDAVTLTALADAAANTEEILAAISSQLGNETFTGYCAVPGSRDAGGHPGPQRLDGDGHEALRRRRRDPPLRRGLAPDPLFGWPGRRIQQLCRPGYPGAMLLSAAGGRLRRRLRVPFGKWHAPHPGRRRHRRRDLSALTKKRKRKTQSSASVFLISEPHSPHPGPPGTRKAGHREGPGSLAGPSGCRPSPASPRLSQGTW